MKRTKTQNLLKHREVTVDKWKTELHTKEFSDVSVSWIGHMIATPTQFFTNFFPRKDYCIQYVINGKGLFFANNKLYNLKKGCLWLLPKEEYHYYMSDPEDPYEYYWIHLDGSGAEAFLDAIGLSEKSPVIKHLHSPNINDQFQKLIQVAQTEHPSNHLVLGRLHILLHEIETDCKILQKHSPSTPQNDVIDDVIAYIKEHYQQDIDLQDLADFVHLDKMYLIKKFKNKTNLTPIQFLIQYRISQSCNLLLSDVSIKTIAIVCGFKNTTNYLRRFKAFLEITPTEYRKSITPVSSKK